MKALVLFHSLIKGQTTETDLTKPVVVTIISKGHTTIQLNDESAKKLGIYSGDILESIFLGDEFTIVMEVNND